MLLTHPLPEDRITDSRERAQNYPPVRLQPSIDYHLSRARIVARYAGIEKKAALDWFDRTEKKRSTPEIVKPSFQYGRALVYLDENKPQEAEEILVKLKKQDPYNNFYLDALSDAYIALKQPEKAQALLEQSLRLKPNNAVLTINLANVHIRQEKYNEALKILQRYTHEHPNDTIGWNLLSEANTHLGNSAEELAARAEILALRANWNKAIQYYTQASQLAPLGSLQQARFDARIDQLMVQRERFLSL